MNITYCIIIYIIFIMCYLYSALYTAYFTYACTLSYISYTIFDFLGVFLTRCALLVRRLAFVPFSPLCIPSDETGAKKYVIRENAFR